MSKTVTCHYCNQKASFIDSARVYGGRSYGMIYFCDCQPDYAYVGVHKGTKKPLGILANGQLRRAKKAAHAAFDPVWKSGSMTRKQAYKWLQEQMGLDASECHIGMFDLDRCARVVELCNGP